MTGNEKVGLFGGTFDPIHTGHLILAQVASDFIGLDRVLFTPTSRPPHKTHAALTDFTVRKEMVELAIAGNPRFELSLIEESDGIVYTFETVLHYSDSGFDREALHLLIGSDSLEELFSWRNPDIIFSRATIVVLKRPGYESLPALPDGAAVIMIETGCNTISSTEIRDLVRNGKSVRYLVPDPVERFIIDNALYRDSA
jgi:nicotinate-nucleotide adenylyltransferase